MSQDNPFVSEDLNTSASEPMFTGESVELQKKEPKQIIITVGDDGNVSYAYSEELKKYEILGSISVVHEHLKREIIFDPVFAGLNTPSNKQEGQLVDKFSQLIREYNNGNLYRN